jgi:adhesin transport system membrane fusion protein
MPVSKSDSSGNDGGEALMPPAAVVGEPSLHDLLAGVRGECVSFLRALSKVLEGPQIFLWLMAAIMVSAVVWASLAQVDRVVRVEGHIIPAGRSQSIQHLEGGIVAAINVQEGAIVHKGEVLLDIDDTTAQASLQDSKSKLEHLHLTRVRLETEAKGEDTMVVPESLRDNPDLVEAEQQLFRSHRQKLEQELRIFEEQIHQRNTEMEQVDVRRQRLAGELNTARERSKLMVGMAAHAAASQIEVLEAESREQRLATEMSDAEASIPKLHGAIAEAQARMEEERARYHAEVEASLATAMQDIERLESVITAQADRYIRTEVRAPVDGIVNRITVNTVGGVVKPGDTIIELTPTTDKILVESRARPSDRGELRVGLPAKVRVSAYDVGELGILTGRVTEVSADTVQEARGEPYYRVMILVDDLPESYAGKQIVPGMTITGDVVIGRRTVMKYIISPFAKFTYNAFRDAR